MPSQPVREQPCPQCAAAIPVHTGYVTWCDGCGWNLKPQTVREPKNLFEKTSMRIGKRMGGDLYRKVLAAERIEPELDGSKIAAYALATLTYVVTAGLAAIGVYLLATGWPNIFMLFIGALSLFIAIASRPRLGTPEKNVATRESFPELYRVVDMVADTLGAPKVDAIVLDARFNAAYGQIGWRRRRQLWLGVPLVETLNEAEFIALIGHELGHSINKDSTRGFYLGTAIDNLALWYALIIPEHIFSSDGGAPGLLMAPFNLALMALAQIPKGGAILMASLVCRGKQRAEYLADYLASVAAGREASMAMLDKLQLRYIYEYSIQRTATNRDARPLFAELGHQLSLLPRRELERLRKVSMMEDSMLDNTHPPTHFRIGFMKERGEPEGRVKIAGESWRMVKKELERVHAAIARHAIDTYTWSIH